MNKKIVGYEAEKKELAKLRDMLVNAERFREKGIRLPRGLILWGKPGVGKTVLAHSILDNELKMFELKAANCCNDNAASEVKGIFARAKANTPCVILLDEIDKIAGLSNGFNRTNDFVNKTLLQELDALTSDMDILVVATCNESDSLGPALTRSGRFDRIINVQKPDKATRKEILKMYFSYINIEKDLDYEYLSKLTVGCSGATLECIANEAAIRAVENDRNVITILDVREVIDKMNFGTEAKASSQDEKSIRQTAVHEAGHCLVALILCPDAVEGISIMHRGCSEGHVKLNLSDGKSMSVEDCENIITIALAGHVAEREVLGSYYLGSVSDMQKAASMVQKLIVDECAYGYNFVGAGDPMSRAMAKNTANDSLSQTQNEIMTRLDKRAAEIISLHRELFDRIVETVLERKTLSKAEIEEIAATELSTVAA